MRTLQQQYMYDSGYGEKHKSVVVCNEHVVGQYKTQCQHSIYKEDNGSEYTLTL